MQTAISSKITTPSPEHDLYWVELEKNSKSVKTLSSKHRLLCTEPYAQELYNLYVGKSTAVDNTVIKPGLVLSGKVVNITNKYVAVDIFNKDYVIVDNSNSDSKIISALTYGQNVQVAITEILDKPYTIKGSFSLASNINNYHIMSSYCNSSTPINVKIVSHIGPGYLVETNIDGTIIEAFLPNLVAGINKIVDAKTLIDQSFDVKDYFPNDFQFIDFLGDKSFLYFFAIPGFRLKAYNSLVEGNKVAIPKERVQDFSKHIN